MRKYISVLRVSGISNFERFRDFANKMINALDFHSKNSEDRSVVVDEFKTGKLDLSMATGYLYTLRRLLDNYFVNYELGAPTTSILLNGSHLSSDGNVVLSDHVSSSDSAKVMKDFNELKEFLMEDIFANSSLKNSDTFIKMFVSNLEVETASIPIGQLGDLIINNYDR